MQWLLIALGVFVGGGLLAALNQRSPRLSTWLGGLASVSGSLAGGYGIWIVGNGQSENFFRAPWDVPFGSLSLGLDPLSMFFASVLLAVAGLTAIYGMGYVAPLRGIKKVGGLWLFFNLLVASALTVMLARNGMLFLIAWEVMSLSAYVLITFDEQDQEACAAGRTFLVAAHLGTAFLLVFFALLGARSASLDFADFAITPTTASASLLFLLALIGFGTKAGLMPLHVWLPESYPVAPSFVTALLSGAMSKIGVYGLLRALLLIGPPQAWWGWLLVGAGSLSAILGILNALVQSDLKRLLAYSSIENIGIITMGIGLGVLGLATHSPTLTLLGFAGALFHVLNHSMFKTLLFLAAGVVSAATGTRELDKLGGLLKRMPWTGTAFLFGAVAIAGLPPFNGFAGEFLLYVASFGHEGLLGPSPTAIVALAVIATLSLVGGLAAFAFAKAFGIAFLGEPRSQQATEAEEPPVIMAAPIVLLAVACLCVGLVSPHIVSGLSPVVTQITGEPGHVAETRTVLALAPLTIVARLSSGLVLLVGVLALARRVMLSRREVTSSTTWGCGYSTSTPRIQYTGSSFVQPAIEFFAPLIRASRVVERPHGLFPRSASLATSSSDMAKDWIYHPLFASIGMALSRLRWLQQGRVQVYILYIGCTLVALMVWYASTEQIQPASPPASAAPTTQISR